MVFFGSIFYFAVINLGNFEDAIKATGFGKFNIGLFCVLISGGFAQIAEQTSLAYIIPIAQCNLNLSLEQKGLLVSISYTGEYILFQEFFKLIKSNFNSNYKNIIIILIPSITSLQWKNCSKFKNRSLLIEYCNRIHCNMCFCTFCSKIANEKGKERHKLQNAIRIKCYILEK